MVAPGMAEADTEGAGFCCTEPGSVGDDGLYGDGGTRTAGVETGVAGPEGEGDGESTTHILNTISCYHIID